VRHGGGPLLPALLLQPLTSANWPFFSPQGDMVNLDTGLKNFTAADQLAFIAKVATAAHELGLAFGLKVRPAALQRPGAADVQLLCMRVGSWNAVAAARCTH
jgi:hypothetical protein